MVSGQKDKEVNDHETRNKSDIQDIGLHGEYICLDSMLPNLSLNLPL